MKKYILVVCFALILLASFNYSQASNSELGPFKQNTCASIIQTCSNCTYVNISSVSYPDSLQALGESSMQKNGTFYNLTFCDTSNLGVYQVNGHGDLDGADQVWSYTFSITPAGGAENNTIIFIILASLSIILLILAFVFENYAFSIISGFAWMGTGVYGMIYGFGNITNAYTGIISIVVIGFGAIITIISGLNMIGENEGTLRTEDDF